MGVMFGKNGASDRLILLGGDDEENNVYYSDDCGATFFCYDGFPSPDPSGDQDWDPRGFAPLVHPLGVFNDDPLFMMGGAVDEVIPSIGMFMAATNGTNDWFRPPCTGPGNNCGCVGDFLCLPGPAPGASYAPVWPGMVANDANKMCAWNPARR